VNSTYLIVWIFGSILALAAILLVVSSMRKESAPTRQRSDANDATSGTAGLFFFGSGSDAAHPRDANDADGNHDAGSGDGSDAGVGGDAGGGDGGGGDGGGGGGGGD